MSRRLRYQHESSQPDSGGRYYGVEVFHDAAEGFWTARYHCRTYDGIKVASSYATDEIRLDGDTETAALAAARQGYIDFLKCYRVTAVST